MAFQQGFIISLLCSYIYLLYDTPSLHTDQPVAGSIKQVYKVGNFTFEDDYLYLCDKNNQTVIDYIHKENKYTDDYMKSLGTLPLDIAQQLDRDSVLNSIPNECFPIDRLSNFWVGEGFVYWNIDDLYFRSDSDLLSDDCIKVLSPELLLNVSDYINGYSYSLVGYFEVMGDLVAFGLDISGNERFDLYVIHFPSKRTLLGPIPNTYYSARWVNYGSEYWIYYNLVDSQWGVPLSIGRAGPFTMSLSQNLIPSYSIIYTESDPALTTELSMTNDLKYLFIKIAGLLTSDYKVVSSYGGATVEIKSILARTPNISYDVEHHNGYFYLKTNHVHGNFAVVRIPVSVIMAQDSPDLGALEEHSTEIIKASDDFIEKIEIFKVGLVYWFRTNGLRRLGIVSLFPPHTVQIFKQSSKVYSLSQDMTGDFDGRFYRKFNTSRLVFSNSSFLEPPALFSLDLSTMKTIQLFTKRSLKSPNDYIEKTIYAFTKDTSESIPISVIYKTTTNFPAPLMILSYGAYGTFVDPSYDPEIYALVDRGFIWAICHPRGDGDMGSTWYRNGKFKFKQHTFDDTDSCIKKLIDDGMTRDGMVVLKGRSAGGLVAGNAVVDPESRANVVIAHVPFIDPIYDSIDESIPWTLYERYEWGNPAIDQDVLSAMIKYSPYHNIKKSIERHQKPLYVSSGLNDPRVPFYEPLKFVAKLRRFAGFLNPILMRVDNGGHFTAHGVNATAEWMAFAIKNIS